MISENENSYWYNAIKELAREYTVQIIGLENKIREQEHKICELEAQLGYAREDGYK
jgi:hypothetical protein